MRRPWLPLVMTALLLSGCAPKIAKPQAETAKPQAETAKPQAEAAKPQAMPAEKFTQKPAAKQPANRVYDDFKLPLVIEMDAPEVPSEIQTPSAPIKQKPEPPSKFPNILRLFL
jgi:hypothetical protein